jgi:hypothetical protein
MKGALRGSPASGKNPSEMLFEQYLDARGLRNWEFEPKIEGKTKRPDYRLIHETAELFFEVKEFRRALPAGSGAYDPYGPIREKINEGYRKFREFKEYCCSLVLYNPAAPLIHLSDPEIMFGCMLGNLGVRVPRALVGGGQAGPATRAFLGGGKMGNHRRRQPQNTTISSVIALSHFPVGQRRLEIEMTKAKQSLARSLTLEECWDLCQRHRTEDGTSIDTRVLRVVVYENPYARVPLPRNIFDGPFDERWGPDGDAIGLIYAGPEIAKLERAVNG